MTAIVPRDDCPRELMETSPGVWRTVTTHTGGCPTFPELPPTYTAQEAGAPLLVGLGDLDPTPVTDLEEHLQDPRHAADLDALLDEAFGPVTR